MAVDSKSTLAEVQAELEDCAGFDVEGSLDKAARFVTAYRILLARRPQRIGHGGTETLEYDLERYETMYRDALQYWQAHSGASGATGSVRYFSLEGFR